MGLDLPIHPTLNLSAACLAVYLHMPVSSNLPVCLSICLSVFCILHRYIHINIHAHTRSNKQRTSKQLMARSAKLSTTLGIGYVRAIRITYGLSLCYWLVPAKTPGHTTAGFYSLGVSRMDLFGPFGLALSSVYWRQSVDSQRYFRGVALGVDLYLDTYIFFLCALDMYI